MISPDDYREVVVDTWCASQVKPQAKMIHKTNHYSQPPQSSVVGWVNFGCVLTWDCHAPYFAIPNIDASLCTCAAQL